MKDIAEERVDLVDATDAMAQARAAAAIGILEDG
jgi:hypothetical protein